MHSTLPGLPVPTGAIARPHRLGCPAFGPVRPVRLRLTWSPRPACLPGPPGPSASPIRPARPAHPWSAQSARLPRPPGPPARPVRPSAPVQPVLVAPSARPVPRPHLHDCPHTFSHTFLPLFIDVLAELPGAEMALWEESSSNFVTVFTILHRDCLFF